MISLKYRVCPLLKPIGRRMACIESLTAKVSLFMLGCRVNGNRVIGMYKGIRNYLFYLGQVSCKEKRNRKELDLKEHSGLKPQQ